MSGSSLSLRRTRLVEAPISVHMPPSIDANESGIRSTLTDKFERAAHVSLTYGIPLGSAPGWVGYCAAPPTSHRQQHRDDGRVVEERRHDSDLIIISKYECSSSRSHL